MSARLIQCPQCQTQLRVPAAAAKIQCPKCQTLLKLNAPAAASSAAPTPPRQSPAPAAATPAPAATPFRPSFAPPAAAGPAAPQAAAGGGDSSPAKSKLVWVLVGSGAALLVLCLLAGAGVAAYMMLGKQPSAATAAGGATAAAPFPQAVPTTTPPLPDSWEAAEVLAASARFPAGAVRRSKTDQLGTHRVISAQTSAVYELQVLIQSPPGEEPLAALQRLTAERDDGPHRWEPLTRNGRDGFRSTGPQGRSGGPSRILEAYPHPDGWVWVSYQAFSDRDAAERPPREVQEDEAELDMPESFMASLSLPAQIPPSTQAMNTQPRFGKLAEAEKQQLYNLYKVAYQQAHQKIKIPRGPARTRTENMLAAVLASEIKKLAAMFDVSEAEVRSIGAEGQALGW